MKTLNELVLHILFEHLMFGGSANIPSYDSPLQMASGSNNALPQQTLPTTTLPCLLRIWKPHFGWKVTAC